jgi:hypothetical protein
MKKGKPTFRIIGDTGVVKTQKQLEDEDKKLMEVIDMVFQIINKNKMANGA